MEDDHTAAIIDLRAFKEFIRTKYSHKTPLYQVIVAEKDEMPCEEYATKFLTWLKLIQISSADGLSEYGRRS